MSDAPLGLFRGESAVVAGGGGHIGGAICRALAAEGASVHVVDVDGDAAAKVAQAIREAGGTAHPAVCDLADRGATDRLCIDLMAAHGSPHMVVHAATPKVPAAVTTLDVDDGAWDEMMEVGVGATRRLARHFAPAMIRAGTRGRFLLVTSLHAEAPWNFGHYSAAKAGMAILTKELARTLGPAGIRVNALAPGYVPRDTNAIAAAKIALGRVGTGDDIARMSVVLLADRFSAYVTGTTVTVDGGLSLYNWIPRR